MNRFWAQSFLLGVPKVVVGYRDDSGYLQDMEELDVMGMPGTAKKNYQTWNGNVCINFASEFLSCEYPLQVKDFLSPVHTIDASCSLEDLYQL